MTMTPTQIGELAAVATAFCWTLSALAWTSAGREIGALAVSFLRLPIACLLLVVYGQAVRGLALPSDADGRTWLVLGISGFMGFFLSDLCLFKSMLLIGPRLSLLIYSLSPPLAATISWLFLGEELALRQWCGMGVTLAGISWVVLEQPAAQRQLEPRAQWGRGMVLAVFGAATQAVGLVLSKNGLGEYDAAAATFIRVLGALAGYLALVTLFRQWPRMVLALRRPRAMFIVALGALVGPFLGVVLSLIALRHCQAGVVATIISTMPVLILPFAIVLYHDRVSLRAAVGAAISVLGVALLVL
jgi:drug/metabolite transporter (DMT)-like permease